ncbi:TetR/AcrR family transcriptional regulator [Bosea sp. UNC402CLCol]|jgi:AcrR family transcriptional regulator|uniref:TetR/AcrR family transcriptional regulator n=1 Tax=Bosea sp. UNC402CLCol TaxID=1510531 RepID=UPI00068FE339|nr:TetR/AcrR family transcriptional regulator [Bosea sp. UNC402CLCol]
MTTRAPPRGGGTRDPRSAGLAPTQRDRKVGSILAAARALFLDHGFDTVSMDMVARQAPVSKATLYAHFASKEELFTAVVVDEAERMTDEIGRIVTDRSDIAAVLKRVAEKFVDIFLSEQAMFLQRAVIGVVPRFPSIGAAIFESGPKALTEHLAAFLGEAHRASKLHVPNPTLAAKQFLSLVRGDLDITRLLLPAAVPSRAELETQIEAGIDLFLHFYAPSET